MAPCARAKPRGILGIDLHTSGKGTGMKHRYFLDYHGDQIELQSGETLVGRGLTCGIRFNDAAVSREHLRFVVEGDVVSVEDLGSTNGSNLNGKPLNAKCTLADGDKIQVGHRWLTLRVLDAATDRFEEDTLDGVEEEWKQQETTPQREVPSIQSLLGDVILPDLTQQNCPRCGRNLALDATECDKCQFKFPGGRPLSVTQRIPLGNVDRRHDARYPVEIPILYSSDTLAIDATARDLSRGGVFIATEILDPVGTPCKVVMLPDASPPVTFEGVVCHVIVAETGEEGRPPGLGVKFTRMGKDAVHWLGHFIERQGAASPPA
jgi:hypothetical protein